VSKVNPYNKFEQRLRKFLRVLGHVIEYSIYAFIIILWFIFLPVWGFVVGAPWYYGFLGWLVTLGIAAILAIFVGISFLWEKFVVDPWDRKKDQWERENR